MEGSEYRYGIFERRLQDFEKQQKAHYIVLEKLLVDMPRANLLS